MIIKTIDSSKAMYISYETRNPTHIWHMYSPLTVLGGFYFLSLLKYVNYILKKSVKISVYISFLSISLNRHKYIYGSNL